MARNVGLVRLIRSIATDGLGKISSRLDVSSTSSDFHDSITVGLLRLLAPFKSEPVGRDQSGRNRPLRVLVNGSNMEAADFNLRRLPRFARPKVFCSGYRGDMDVIGPSIAAAVGSIAGRKLTRPSARIAVNEDWESFGMGEVPRSFFVPRSSVDDLTHLPDLGYRTRNSKPYRWVQENGGFDLSTTSFQFTVYAHNANLDIVGVIPLVERGRVDRKGIALVKPPIGGPLHMRHLSVHLDYEYVEHRSLGDAVTVRDFSRPQEEVSPLAMTLRPGESELFHVQAFTQAHTVRWALLLKMVVNGRATDEMILGTRGQPFVTVSDREPNISGRFEFSNGNWAPR